MGVPIHTNRHSMVRAVTSILQQSYGPWNRVQDAESLRTLTSFYGPWNLRREHGLYGPWNRVQDAESLRI